MAVVPNSFRCITVQSLLPASLGDFSYLCCLMIYSKEHIDLLKRAIIECFGRTLDSPTDYDMLSADIRECTGETISSATLKRLFGYLKPSTAPRPSTLSVLARYVGYRLERLLSSTADGTFGKPRLNTWPKDHGDRCDSRIGHRYVLC